MRFRRLLVLTREKRTLLRRRFFNAFRYWSVTDISYVQNRTPRRIVGMLVAIWTTSLLISLAPFAGWKDKNFVDRVNKQYTCLISQEISYQVFFLIILLTCLEINKNSIPVFEYSKRDFFLKRWSFFLRTMSFSNYASFEKKNF